MTIYLIRHAESEANKSRIMASRMPFPLTKAGKSDADLIASELKEIVNINRIISSPLVRAVQTAESFSKIYNIPVEEDIRLAEQELGIFSGMTYDEVKEQPTYESNPLKRWDWVPEGGGESYSMIAERIKEFFYYLEDSKTEGNILIVTHAVAFRLIQSVLEKTLPNYPKSFPNNGEIWKVEFKSLNVKHKIESILLGNSRDFVHNP